MEINENDYNYMENLARQMEENNNLTERPVRPEEAYRNYTIGADPVNEQDEPSTAPIGEGLISQIEHYTNIINYEEEGLMYSNRAMADTIEVTELKKRITELEETVKRLTAKLTDDFLKENGSFIAPQKK